jgi:mRNA interferase MazF
MNQGDIYWVSLKVPDKKRPALILTRNQSIPELNAVTIIPLTTTIRDLRSQVFVNGDDGLKEESIINIDNIQTVSKNRIGSFITHLSEERMKEVFAAIKFAFDFE